MGRIVSQLRSPEGEHHTTSCDRGCTGAKCGGRREPQPKQESVEFSDSVDAHSVADEDDWHDYRMAQYGAMMQGNRAVGL